MGKFHVSLVVAVSALTVLCTGTVLRGVHSKLFVSTAKPALSSSQTIPDAESARSSAVTNTSTPVAGTVWKQADLSKLMSIATELVSSLSSSDLSALSRDMSAVHPDATVNEKTTEDVLHILQSHIPPDDLAWVQSQFTGSQAFTSDDVTVLQKTVSELESELTPAEQQLVSEEVSSFLAGQSQK